jgi:N-acetylneuraminic acid mutarotase
MMLCLMLGLALAASPASAPVTNASASDVNLAPDGSCPPCPSGAVLGPGSSSPADAVPDTTLVWTQPTTIPTEGVSRTAVCCDAEGKVHVVCGNCQTHTSHPTDQIYDPAANGWSDGLTHPAGGGVGVHNHDAVAINDVIWCGGGSSGSSAFYNNLTKLDLGGSAWTSAAAMPVNDLIYYVMEEYADSGWVYVLGGSPDGTGGPLDSCWRYKTTTGTWDRMANMPAGRRNMMTTRVGDTIYVIGGMSANDYTSTHGTVWKYSVLGNTWTAAADSMPDNLGWGRAVTYTGTDGAHIYVFGGYRAGAIVNSCWRYDVSGGTWHTEHAMTTASRAFGADIHDNLIWVAGGFGSAILANVQKGTIAQTGVEEGSRIHVRSPHGAYPTMFRDLVRISYSLRRSAHVSLGIYDAGGALVRTLVDGTVEPGARTVAWNRTDQSGCRVVSGTYFYRLSVDGKLVSGKAVALQ